MSLADLRKDYTLAGLAEKDLARDPFRQFEKWFQEAEAAKVVEPNAMTLATAGKDGRPSARTVLLKGVDGRGFVFYSNYESRKGRELEINPHATLVFLATARQPARRLGVAAKLDHRRPEGAGKCVEGAGDEVRRPGGAVAAALGWMAPGAGNRGILAGKAQPPA